MQDYRPISDTCSCMACKNYTRAAIHGIARETVACHLLTIHNIAFQLQLMADIREAIIAVVTCVHVYLH